MATSRKLYSVDKERSWDAGEAKKRQEEYASREDGSIDWELVHTFYLWYDENDPEKWTSHKLPVVDIVDGVPKAIWRAIVNARARLNQTDIPESDRREVLAQIRRYYRKAGEEFEEKSSEAVTAEVSFSNFTVNYLSLALASSELKESASITETSNQLRISGVLHKAVYESIAKRAASLKAGDTLYLVIDSPGGEAAGAESAASAIDAARSRGARIYVYAPRQLSSAAYFIASAANGIYAAPDALVGSIGAVAAAVSIKRHLEDSGIDVAVIRSSPLKALPTPFDELSPEARAAVQNIVNAYADRFVRFVTSRRKLAEEALSGSDFIAEKALELGLIDGLITAHQMEDLVKSESELKAQLAALSAEIEALKRERDELKARLEAFLASRVEVHDEIERVRSSYEEKVFKLLGLE
jgi:signal peptide peptidase SppA